MIERLGKQMNLIASQLMDTYNPTLYNNLKEKKRELSLVLNERVKGALFRSSFLSFAEMDTLT